MSLSPIEAGKVSAAESTLAVIMGGGAGTRLFPLTKDRSKPAVPLGGKYRLVDIPISNCLHSNLRRIFILTQFNSVSLHRHIQSTYRFDPFSPGFVEILAAQQTFANNHWYQGTADAVRQNLRYFLQHEYKYYLILSGDQLYRMDFLKLLGEHLSTKADITIATLPVTRADAPSFGIMHTNKDQRIVEFQEKPKTEEQLEKLKIPANLLETLGRGKDEELYQASMGIYIFNREALVECLDNDLVDFGKHIIPRAIKKYDVRSHVFQGYWEDIGSIRSFFNANLDLANIVPPFSFFETHAPIYTHSRFLPASKINAATIRNAIVSDGCVITDATIDRAIIGIRSVIQNGAKITNSVIMGADFYPYDDEFIGSMPVGTPPVGIGKGTTITNAIIDKNARIGDNVVITPAGKPDNLDGENYFIRDGIVVVPKDAIIPSGTWI